MHQQIAALLVLALTSLVSGQSGTVPISYHDYPADGTIGGSCDYYSLVSKYNGMITATTIGSIPCFACIKMTYNGNSIYVTRVDTGGMNFDLNHPAFQQLCGQAGIDAGQCTINYQVVSASNCPGNPNAGSSSKSPPPPPPPPPSSPSSGKSGAKTTRCGKNWSSANSKCGTSCTTNAQCSSGQTCYASLSTSPCGSNAVADQSSTLADTSSSSDAAPSWAIALLVVGFLVTVALVVVMVQLALLLRASA